MQEYTLDGRETTVEERAKLITALDSFLEILGSHHDRTRRSAELRLIEIMCADPVRTGEIGRRIGLSIDLFESEDLRWIASCVRIKAIGDRMKVSHPDAAENSMARLIRDALSESGHMSHDAIRRPYGASVWSPETILQLLRREPWHEPWITSATRNLQHIIDEQREQTTSLLRIRLSLMGAARKVATQGKAVAA